MYVNKCKRGGGKSLYSVYYVPVPVPEKDRPVGVSGLMRVKDEEEFVEASIDSVIDVLDELIICYQECSDDTPNILKRKQKEYPDKIKLYYYEPEIYAHGMTEAEDAYARSLPDDSIHLLSGYYNYTLSKATYRYALKIDADQIYLTDKMKQLCDAYRSDKRVALSWRERLAGKCVYNYNLGYKTRIKKLCIKLLSLCGSYDAFYWQYVLKRITNEKCLVWLSGIQLCVCGDELSVGTVTGNGYALYNGTYDHCIFRISSDTYYVPGRHFTCRSFIESFSFNRNQPAVCAGFVWFHIRGCKRCNRDLQKDNKVLKYSLFKATPFKRLQKLGFASTGEFKSFDDLFSFFHDESGLPDIEPVLKYTKNSKL